MTIYLVRHARAGERGAWRQDDWLRPLSRAGRRRLVGCSRLLRDAVRPRAQQPVRPLHRDRSFRSPAPAGSRSNPTTRSPRAAISTRCSRIVRKHIGSGAVLCSHGDVIPAVLAHLAASGVDLGRRPALPEGMHMGARGRRWRRRRAACGYLPPPPDPDE